MDKFLPLVNREYCCKIWVDEILYIEQICRTINIVTEKGTFYDYEKIVNLYPYLDEYFVHCLKNTVVNFNQVQSMMNQTITFKNGTTFTFGRQNFIITKQKFVLYMKNRELFLKSQQADRLDRIQNSVKKSEK